MGQIRARRYKTSIHAVIELRAVVVPRRRLRVREQVYPPARSAKRGIRMMTSITFIVRGWNHIIVMRIIVYVMRHGRSGAGGVDDAPITAAGQAQGVVHACLVGGRVLNVKK